MKLIRCFAMVLTLFTLLCTAALAECDHNIVTDRAKAPTCTKTGLTEGSHCSKCNKVFKDQTMVPMLNHDFKLQPGHTIGHGKHEHICKRCPANWVIKCTLLDDNHCVTCEYQVDTLVVTDETEEQIAEQIAAGKPLLVVRSLDAGDAAMRFNIEMYEDGEPIDFHIEAIFRLPLNEDQIAALSGNVKMTSEQMMPLEIKAWETQHEETLTVPFEIVDGVMVFRTNLRGDFVIK